MLSRYCIITIVAFTCCLNAAGHNIRHYDVSAGLSENTVKGITQDSDGYMWFGTQDGLNVFNGRDFTSFGCSYHDIAGRDEGPLNILSVLLHPDGKRIWLVCRSAVTLFDPASRKYKDIPFPEKVTPTCATYAQDGRLWIGTENGLYIYTEADGTVEKCHVCASSESDKNINSILRDARGTIWVCGEDGFFRFSPFKKGFERISSRNALSVFEDRSGGIWVGLWYDGFAKYNPETNQIDLLPRIREDGKSMEFLRVRSMLEDEPGNILICTNRGLFKFSSATGKLSKIVLTAQRATDNVYCCFKDREGGIWIGTYFKGLYYLLPKDGVVEAYTPDNTSEYFHGSAVSSFCEDGKGRIWTGAENGGLSLFIPTDGTFRPLPFRNPANNMHSLCIDSDNLYIGTFAQGMIHVDLKSGVIKEYLNNGPGTIPDNHVFSLFKLHNGKILVGTRRGCAVFDPSVKKFSDIRQLSNAFIYGICEDVSGNIWFADYYNGLHKLEGLDGMYRHFRHQDDNPSSLPCDRLVNVQIDDHGQLWISSDGGGLCRYDSEADIFIPFTIRDSSEIRKISVIYGCLNDNEGNLWISSNDGIWCCDTSGKGKHLTSADGLQSNQFNYGAAFRSSKGKLYFGGINGFNVIDPYAVAIDIPQPLMTASVSWNTNDSLPHSYRQIKDSGLVTIPRDISNFTISFECLSYSAPENTRIDYSIDGHIDFSTNKGSVDFADFPYGKHLLTARAVTSKGTLSSNEVNITIDNIPPLYLSLGAKTLYFILFIGLAISIVIWTVRRKQSKAEKEAYEAKLNFFTQIAHEIKTPVTLIKGPLEVILNERLPGRTRHHLEIIHKNTDRLQDLIGQLLDFKKISTEGYALNLQTVKPDQTLKTVVERFSGAIQGKLEISLEVKDDIDSCRIDPEAFTKITSNLLSNAVKYTRNTIKVELSRRRIDRNNYIHLCVKDNGNGIPAEEARKVFDSFYQVRSDNAERVPGIGIGLSLVKLLAEKHNGRAYVDTSYTEGCSICVDIPYIPAKLHSSESGDTTKTGVSGIRVLIVEDNAEMLDFLRSSLEEEYSVLEAANGNEALAVLRDKDVDIILSDIYMPDGDGFMLLQGVRSDEMLCHIPLILLTAESSLDAKIKGLEYGANAYIEKPFSMEQLLATIKNILKDREIMRKSFLSGSALPSTRNGEQSQDSIFLEKISRIILERMGESWISVEELAETMNVSHSSLQRKIKGLTGLSPVEFIRNVKLKKAAELLASGEYRVNEVCYAIGFTKPSYFSSCFKNQFGVLPKDYVKRK